MTEYPLPNEDIEYLNANHGDKWYLKLDSLNNPVGLIIKDYKLPDGYHPDQSNLMVLIPSNYPMSGIDMFYFCPDVLRKDGKVLGALTPEKHFDKRWQRWSRHYEWRPGIDCIATHISYVRNQLNSELKG